MGGRQSISPHNEIHAMITAARKQTVRARHNHFPTGGVRNADNLVSTEEY